MQITAADFRTAHGDVTTWSSRDCEAYENCAEIADPTYRAAIADNRKVLGRHEEDGKVVVIAVTADGLKARRHALVIGNSGRGKTSLAAVAALAALAALAAKPDGSL